MALVELDLISCVPVPRILPREHPSGEPARAPAESAAPAPACIPTYRGLLALSSPAGRRFQRALEIAPGALTWLLVTAPVWAGLLLPFPFAVAVLAFDLFWLYLSASTAWRAYRGYRRVRLAEQTDWRREFRIAESFGRTFAGWDEIFHVVIIPSYKEPLEMLRRTLRSLAAQQNAGQIVVVLALEAREPGAGQKARKLEEEFGGCFDRMFSTFHPAGIPGEVAGKSSNENWAARIAKRHLVDDVGYDLRTLTVTSCDADSVFHPAYFACLSYKFATDHHRYRRFWQSPILLHNNIWETAAPLRVGSALAGTHILANLCKRDRVVFPQSTYSLSLQMADDVGYWDPDVIPEDWHMFLKCFFTFSGAVEVEPIYLPTGNDAVRADTTWRSFVEAFQQHKRHAWGASDIPYAVREALAHTEIPRRRRARRVIALTANHLLWTTHWFLLSFGWGAPWVALWILHRLFGGGDGVDPLQFLLGGGWIMRWMLGGEVEVNWLQAAGGLALWACVIPYVAMILIDSRLRPAKPAWWRRRHGIVATIMWAALPFTSLVFSTVPALVAQTRLMLGRRLEYRVTEKV